MANNNGSNSGKVAAKLLNDASKIAKAINTDFASMETNLIRFALCYREYVAVTDNTPETAKTFVDKAFPHLDENTRKTKTSEMRTFTLPGAIDIPESFYLETVTAWHAATPKAERGGRSPYGCCLRFNRAARDAAEKSTVLARDTAAIAAACPPKAKPAKGNPPTPPAAPETPEQRAVTYRASIIHAMTDAVNAATALRDSKVKLSAKEKKAIAAILAFQSEVKPLEVATPAV
jgi:hypothetical protein